MPLGTEKTALLGASAGGAISEVELLVVASGGSGGSNGGGGGGAGGYRTSAAYAVEVGVNIAVVSTSSFGTITSSGGGSGGTYHGVGTAGGSGGGGASSMNGGAGNSGGYDPVEGFAGSGSGTTMTGGGGGGASEVGTVPGTNGGPGGDGSSNSITGTATHYSGGGGGGKERASGTGGGSGGGGGGMLSACVAVEELCRVCYNTAYLLVVQWVPFGAILAGGSQAQKDRFLPGLASGELRGAISTTEAQSGPDVAGIRTRAARVDGGYRLVKVSPTNQFPWSSHIELIGRFERL